MSVEDSPSIQHLREMISGMRELLAAGGFLFGAKKKELLGQLHDMESKLERMISYRKRFSEYFTEHGWLAHEMMPVSKIEEAVNVFEEQGIDAAQDILMEFYSADELSKRINFSFMNSNELRIRRNLIELAYKDYVAARHHAVIPVLIAIMDGAVNDVARRGLHAESADLDAWDSITVTDGAIQKIRDTFCRGRNKTRVESIDMPYRNGILHGTDLGYANQIVAAKTWCFLFVVSDWIASKKSEESRRKKHQEDTRIPSWDEIENTISTTQALKDGCASWQARKIEKTYISSLNTGKGAELGSPEEQALQFMEYMIAKNYGHMAKLYASLFTNKPNEVRCQYDHLDLKGFKITSITDDAPGRATVLFAIDSDFTSRTEMFVSLVYQSESGEALAYGMPGGRWYIATAYPR